MITEGVTVLMIVNLDSGTGKAVLDKARPQGVATIDYDRLTLGGGAEYYVCFDNVAVGELQGEGLAKCLTDEGRKPIVAYLNGSPTDNNATLFKQGAHAVLDAEVRAGSTPRAPSRPCPDWDNQQAATIFEQMLTQTGGEIDGVLAANDGLGNAAISVLKKNNLNGKVPVTGQDADRAGPAEHPRRRPVHDRLQGRQARRPTRPPSSAIALAKGESRKDDRHTVKRPRERPRRARRCCWSRRRSSRDTSRTSSTTATSTEAELCTGRFAELCTEAGIS